MLKLIFTRLLFPGLLASVAMDIHAQSFVHKATKENSYCNATCTVLDNPDLNNNPAAIIMIHNNNADLNPHPIGVYYTKNKWNIFNLDQQVMPTGATFNVTYVTRPDADHFQYSTTLENIQKDGSAIIDHPALNNRPDARLEFLLSWNPDLKQWANRDSVNMHFNNAIGKWMVSNINKKAMYHNVAYNFYINSGRMSSSDKAVGIKELQVDAVTPITPITTIPCNCPASLPPNGNAGGDLSGTFPLPIVQKLRGNPLSNLIPTKGQVLKWNGTEWAPANDSINQGSVANWLFNNVIEMTQSGGPVPSSPTGTDLPGMGYSDLSLTVTTTSKLIVSLTGDMESISCFACVNTNGFVKTQINKDGVGMKVLFGAGSAANGTTTTLNSGIKVFTISPGTYTFFSYAFVQGGPPGRFSNGKLLVVIIPQ